MSSYITARIIGMLPTLLLLVLFVVVLVRILPGDAVDVMLQENAQSAGAARAEIEARLGLDKSLPEAYVSYVTNLFRGDLSNSIWSQAPVTELIAQRLPVTLKLGVVAIVLSTVVGLLIGIVSAVRQNTPADYLLRSFAILNLSVPNFAVATLVIVLPTIWWGWSPSVIYIRPSDGFIAHYNQFLIPAVILGLSGSATIMRLTRTSMLEVTRQDYIRTARSKGLNERVVIFRHALKNALIPVVSLLGLQVSAIVSGTVIIETVFGLPGIGRLLISSIAIRDYPVIQGITVLTGAAVMVTNLLVDISYVWLDPRIRGR